MKSQPLKNMSVDLVSNPLLSDWISIDQDGLIVLRTGKVELGQGIGIAQLQIVADELDVPLSTIRMIAGHTDYSPDQGYTAGSNSIQVGGMALRQVCAQVRDLFLQMAARALSVPAKEIQIQDGYFFSATSPTRLSYQALSAQVNLNCKVSELARPKAAAERRISGSSHTRPDLNKKLFAAGFIHDISLEGMLHARLVRPPSYDAMLIELSPAHQTEIQAMPGVHTLLVSGRYVGVCAEREEQAIAAAERIRQYIIWQEPANLPSEQEGQAWLRTLPSTDSVVDASPEQISTASVLKDPAQSVSQSICRNYSKPFIAHASIGPSCGLASWEGRHLTVWTHGQGSFPMQRELAHLFGLPDAEVTVIHADGAGCYGHNGADDAAADAAMLAQATGCPVRVQWMREDEFHWSPHGSAMSLRIEAGINQAGKIVQWNQQIWSQTHVQRPGVSPELKCLAALHRDPPAPVSVPTDFALVAGGGGQRNAIPIYDLPQRKIDYHLVVTPTLRSSALRALGAYANVFAIESCMDELAALANMDPLDFRLTHLSDPRAREVLETVATLSNWKASRPSAQPESGGQTRGRGLGFARYKNSAAYCAVVIDIEVTDRIILDQVWVVVDAGEIIHADGLSNQIEGGVLQAASWTLKEALHWDQTRLTTHHWEDYPILGFSQTPRNMKIQCINRPELPPLGSGECAAGPTAAAIANALSDALGLRMRDLPLTPERLAQAVMQD